MRGSKYNAVKVKIDGYTFDSKQEHKRYCELKLMEKAKVIFMLRVHPKFDIQINHKHFCTYIGDFDYLLCGQGYEKMDDFSMLKRIKSTYVLEDVKAIRTAAYMLKKKALFLDKGITITEINVLQRKKRDDNAKIKANSVRRKSSATDGNQRRSNQQVLSGLNRR